MFGVKKKKKNLVLKELKVISSQLTCMNTWNLIYYASACSLPVWMFTNPVSECSLAGLDVKFKKSAAFKPKSVASQYFWSEVTDSGGG